MKNFFKIGLLTSAVLFLSACDQFDLDNKKTSFITVIQAKKSLVLVSMIKNIRLNQVKWLYNAVTW